MIWNLACWLGREETSSLRTHLFDNNASLWQYNSLSMDSSIRCHRTLYSLFFYWFKRNLLLFLRKLLFIYFKIDLGVIGTLLLFKGWVISGHCNTLVIWNRSAAQLHRNRCCVHKTTSTSLDRCGRLSFELALSLIYSQLILMCCLLLNLEHSAHCALHICGATLLDQSSILIPWVSCESRCRFRVGLEFALHHNYLMVIGRWSTINKQALRFFQFFPILGLAFVIFRNRSNIFMWTMIWLGHHKFVRWFLGHQIYYRHFFLLGIAHLNLAYCRGQLFLAKLTRRELLYKLEVVVLCRKWATLLIFYSLHTFYIAEHCWSCHRGKDLLRLGHNLNVVI